ncbi:hypothetical protein MPH_03970 [Macrophomina phaseolina MS6]|uniref:Altered inheritance of mitochondria protein 6 n=1 Tax=Macrophomina phaseolina (strain MS6) TaxID=1126212 RepID=K2S8K9_MACPH|nr:hypothetical protein MPH_03970 [Macrophomina phaseolina MS6]
MYRFTRDCLTAPFQRRRTCGWLMGLCTLITKLQVGHEESALTSARTFASLYIDPILDTLHRQNPITPFAPNPTKNGVFDTSSGQTLYLWIDLKTSADDTFPAAHTALQPLRDAGFLTTYYPGNDTLVKGAVTAIGTGNTRLSDVLDQDAAVRDVFYDAPLAALPENITGPEISPIASTQFSAHFGKVTSADVPALNDSSLALLKEQVDAAHAKGIGARYWDTPGYPIGTRNAVWRTLIDAGVDLLNVDDLAGAAGLWERE